jgi:hypothetical protein
LPATKICPHPRRRGMYKTYGYCRSPTIIGSLEDNPWQTTNDPTIEGDSERRRKKSTE